MSEMLQSWDSSQTYTRVKLCEFENLDSAYEASFIGADFLGFHLFSDQDVAAKTANFEAIFAELPSLVDMTLLTDVPVDQLLPILKRLQPGSIQYYDDTPTDDLDRVRQAFPEMRILKVMSAQPVENFTPSTEAFLDRYLPFSDAILLDSVRDGGSGITSDWDHCAEVVRLSEKPVFLAGGLNPYNVRDAIERVRPFGVDVETGVSNRLPSGVRLKNVLKCRLFVEAVREADWRLGRR